MEIIRLSQKEESVYHNYVNNHPKATFEYSLVWRNIIEKSFNFLPCYLIAKENGTVKGVLPLFKASGIFGKRLVSLPFSIYAGPLTEDEKTKMALIEQAKGIVNKENIDYLEIREKQEDHCLPQYQQMSARSDVFLFSLSLAEGPDKIWKKLPKSSIRWGIKKAQNCGLTFTSSSSAEDLATFYRLFSLTRKYRGVPGYPFSYFQEIRWAMEDKIKIYTAYKEKKALASIFLIYHNKEVRYAFAGSLSEKKYLSCQPYHLILWQAVKDACADGCTTFNFGGTTANTNSGGLYDFKKKWSDKIVPASSSFYLNKSKGASLPRTDASPLFRTASIVWKHLPLKVTVRLTPPVIKQFV